jgi:hypothetical protein
MYHVAATLVLPIHTSVGQYCDACSDLLWSGSIEEVTHTDHISNVIVIQNNVTD